MERISHRSNLLASIVESSDDAIISFMLSGTVLSWNRGAQELFGYSVESTMGKTLNQLIGPQMGHVLSKLKKGEKLDTMEIVYTKGDGHVYNFSARVFPIKDDAGKVVSGAAIFRDITQTKQAEKELLITSEQLAQSNKELEEFAWVAAHDLKEPVRTMGTYSKLLLNEYEDKLDEHGQQFLEYIYQASLKAINRIDDVLKFSAVRRDKLQTENVDLAKLLDDVLEDLSMAVTESKASIIVGDLPVIQGNIDYLSLLFQNLLSNAIKYSGNSFPSIEIAAERSGEFWKFSVRDHGIGFEQAHSEKIFRMFQRLHDQSEYPGTGLGLSMCKKVVESHGGRIWAESNPGEGSVFYFTLPAD